MEDIICPSGDIDAMIAQAEKLSITSIILLDKKHPKLRCAVSKPKRDELGLIKAGADVRAWMERTKENYFYGFEDSEKKDFIHHRNSGLNQVICKIMKDRAHHYCFRIQDCSDSFKVGRIMQNIRFCNKYGIPVHPITLGTTPLQMRSKSDMVALLRILSTD
ncbi:hypothetical protein H6504_02885 [Candidatus Woesearchaeota archaeon]|nr:hypothetical protein [Candidatus Woesearchaeota archaeon]